MKSKINKRVVKLSLELRKCVWQGEIQVTGLCKTLSPCSQFSCPAEAGGLFQVVHSKFESSTTHHLTGYSGMGVIYGDTPPPPPISHWVRLLNIPELKCLPTPLCHSCLVGLTSTGGLERETRLLWYLGVLLGVWVQALRQRRGLKVVFLPPGKLLEMPDCGMREARYHSHFSDVLSVSLHPQKEGWGVQGGVGLGNPPGAGRGQQHKWAETTSFGSLH